MKTIVICNQKGGVGKTTTTKALCNALTLKGKKVLCVDANAQRNLSQSFGADTDGLTVKSILLEPAATKDAIQTTEQGDIIPGDTDLASIDFKLKESNDYYSLSNALSQIKRSYDYCLIDSPPFFGTLLLNTLMASDYAIIVAEADVFSITGVQDIGENIKTIRDAGHKIKIAGILLTRYTGRATLSRQLLEVFKEPAKELKTKLFSTPIRENISIKESALLQKDLFKYAPRSNGAKDYMAFTEELLSRIE